MYPLSPVPVFPDSLVDRSELKDEPGLDLILDTYNVTFLGPNRTVGLCLTVLVLTIETIGTGCLYPAWRPLHKDQYEDPFWTCITGIHVTCWYRHQKGN